MENTNRQKLKNNSRCSNSSKVLKLLQGDIANKT